MRQNDGPKRDEDLLDLDPETLPFGEQEEEILRGMMGLPVIVDLDWSPESDEDEEGEEFDFKTLQLQLIAAESMSAIENLDYEESYEQLQWNEEMVEAKCCLVPTKNCGNPCCCQDGYAWRSTEARSQVNRRTTSPMMVDNAYALPWVAPWSAATQCMGRVKRRGAHS